MRTAFLLPEISALSSDALGYGSAFTGRECFFFFIFARCNYCTDSKFGVVFFSVTVFSQFINNRYCVIFTQGNLGVTYTVSSATTRWFRSCETSRCRETPKKCRIFTPAAEIR